MVSPAHSYFLECLRRCYPTHASSRDGDNGHVTINATQLSTGFEQYFSYERVKELVNTYNIVFKITFIVSLLGIMAITADHRALVHKHTFDRFAM